MRTLLIKAIRPIVGVVPRSVKRKLAKLPFLHQAYAKELRKADIFLGAPGSKQTVKRYRKIKKVQQSVVNSLTLPMDSEATLDVCVVHDNAADASLTSTLQSIFNSELKPRKIVILTEESLERVAPTLIKGVEKKDVYSINQADGVDSVLCLKSGDRLADSFAHLFHFMSREFDVVYSDREMVTADGEIQAIECLSDWDRLLQLGSGYVHTGILINRSHTFAKKELCLTSSRDSIQQLMTALAEYQNAKVGHMPLPLIEATQTSAFVTRGSKTDTAAVPDDLVRNQPLVSLIMPTKNGKHLVETAINSILEKTSYQNFEIILVDNGSDEQESLEYFEQLSRHPKIKVLQYPHAFNFSAINNFAVKAAKGDVIGLINNDVEVINAQWLSEMLKLCVRDDIGCVGAKLFYPDGRIQHSGVVLGYGEGAGHAFKLFPGDHDGYLGRLKYTHTFSAVTAACLLVKRSLYDEVGGLNESDLIVAFNDVDFCLKVRELGKRNVYCAEALLFHHESVSRGSDAHGEKAIRFAKELKYLRDNWGEVIANDPAYNINLTRKRENFGLRETQELNELYKKRLRDNIIRHLDVSKTQMKTGS